MPSIDDVYNQLVAVNGTLNQIHADGVAETNAITQVKASVDTLDNDVKTGFNNTVNALNAIAQIEIEAVKLLFHLTQQADTMICALEHISKNTCEILNQVTIQTRLQTRLAENVDAIREIEESIHPEAELERQRLARLHKEIEKCCPPEKAGPACSYEPCPAPRPPRMPDLPNISKEPQPIK